MSQVIPVPVALNSGVCILLVGVEVGAPPAATAVGAPSGDGGLDTAERLSVPGFEAVVVALYHTVGAPAWLTSWHLLSGFVGLLCCLEGGGRVYASE